MRKQYYEYRYLVSLEETDLVGGVPAVNYARWQGRCVEMFLLENAPGVLDELHGDLELATLESVCVRVAEVSALDEVSVRMRLVELTSTQIGLAFDVVRIRDGAERLAARGCRRMACMRWVRGVRVPTRVPVQLRAALRDDMIPVVRAMAGTGGRV